MDRIRGISFFYLFYFFFASFFLVFSLFFLRGKGKEEKGREGRKHFVRFKTRRIYDTQKASVRSDCSSAFRCPFYSISHDNYRMKRIRILLLDNLSIGTYICYTVTIIIVTKQPSSWHGSYPCEPSSTVPCVQ